MPDFEFLAKPAGKYQDVLTGDFTQHISIRRLDQTAGHGSNDASLFSN